MIKNKINITALAFLAIFLNIISCKKNNDKSNYTTKKDSLKKELLAVTDVRWFAYALDKAKKDNPTLNIKERNEVAIKNLDFIFEVQDIVLNEWIASGGTKKELEGIYKDLEQELINAYKQPEYRPEQLDVNIWNKYLVQLQPIGNKGNSKILSKASSNIKRKLMFTGEELEEVEIKGCRVAESFQYYAMMGPVALQEQLGSCRASAIMRILNTYMEVARGYSTCLEAQGRIVGYMNDFNMCDYQGNGNAGGGDSGSGSGTGSSPSSWTSFRLEVDNTARPCLNSMASGTSINANLVTTYQNLFSGETDFNTVSGMIVRISNSTDWNVKIKEGAIPDRVDASTGDTSMVNAQTTASGGMVYVTFNNSYLNQATDLAIARTMIHELMHAYFVYGLSKINDPGYPQFVEANDLLFKKNGNPANDQNNAQHQQIAAKYVDGLAGMLEFYAYSNGISCPDPTLTLKEYCTDLAWGGLSETKAYRKYAPNKTRIEANLQKEQTNSSGSTNKKGC